MGAPEVSKVLKWWGYGPCGTPADGRPMMRASMAWIAIGLAGGSAIWVDVGWEVGIAAMIISVLIRTVTAHPTSWIAFGLGVGVCLSLIHI